MSCHFSIQSEIWAGYGAAAEVLGDKYKFYRPHGTTKKPQYDTDLQYGDRVQYGDKQAFDNSGGKFDDGKVYDLDTSPAADPVNLDTPGARFDQGNQFDETDPSAVDETQFNNSQDFDDGFRWDQPGNLIATLYVSLNAEDMTYKKPNKYGEATWYALVDGADLQVGDYFIGPEGTFFIAAMQKLLPILVVECNRVVSIYRPQAQTGIGAVDYGGTTDANMTRIAQNRPCSIQQGTKGEKSDANLPGDTRSAWYAVLLPESGIIIEPDDILIDDLGHRYVASSIELTDLGYRLSVMTAVP